MIDVDHMESQLQLAPRARGRAPRRVRPVEPPPAPLPAAAPLPRSAAPSIAATSARVLARLRVPVALPEDIAEAPPRRASSRLVQLVEDGDLADAGRLVADSPSRRETVSWAAMRALFGGDQDTARAKNRAMRALARETRDPEAMERYWLQRFWLVMAWGTEEECEEVAGHCRDRADRADDLGWMSALAVLAARMGDSEEAREAFEDAFGRLGRADESIQLDVATNLVEAAALLGDAFLAARLHYMLGWTSGRLVTVGEGWVCKGAIERFRALGEAAAGMFAEADGHFGRAVARHRALGAAPLLAQTLHQWGTTLTGRDEERAAACFTEARTLARTLQLTDPRLLAQTSSGMPRLRV